jgi:hypothetical protein
MCAERLFAAIELTLNGTLFIFAEREGDRRNLEFGLSRNAKKTAQSKIGKSVAIGNRPNSAKDILPAA